ncbi:MAG: serine/threonine protein kinase [Burkholderiales bacterium]|nr:serine/threonine protein kinase [Burkholderiales bacterium]
MIDRDAWQQLSALLDEALALEGDERAAWLAALARREPAAAARVERALAAAQQTTAPTIARTGGLFAAALGPAVAAEDLRGLRLGAWELREKIGQGGMGEVWRALRADGLYDAQAAIKLLRSDLALEMLRARFDRERALLARLNHPAIARLLDAGIDQGRAYLVLELVEGRTLDDHVRLHELPLAARVRLLMRIAEAVDYAHARLIVHRDLKPANVLVTEAGEAKLLDFGIAGLLAEGDEGAAGDGELTRLTGRALTPGYAAPEQISGEPIGTAADVFSLGVMLYELISGCLPFGARRSTRQASERAVLHDEPRRLTELGEIEPTGPGRPVDFAKARGDLEAIAAKALRKDPAQRYGSARALIDDLQRWLASEPVSVRRDDWRHRGRLWLRRNAWPAAAAALVTLALSVGLGISRWQWLRADRAAHQSNAVTTYMTDLLASAGPEAHGGHWPTVLELLDRSAAELPQKFRDDPATRLRLMQVLTETYLALNRFDTARKIGRQWLALATAQGGSDSPSALLAAMNLGQIDQTTHDAAAAIAILEPLEQPMRKAFGDGEELRNYEAVIANAYALAMRFADADRAEAEYGRLNERLRPDDVQAQLDYQNSVATLRSMEGRIHEACDMLRQSERYWNRTEPEIARQLLMMRRNRLECQIRLGEYRDVEARSRQLVVDLDRLFGPGTLMTDLQYQMLATYESQLGRHDLAATELEALLRLGRDQGRTGDATMAIARAQLQLALARQWSRPEPRAALRAEMASLLATGARQLPGRRSALIALAEAALVRDDAASAAAGLAGLSDADRGQKTRFGEFERAAGELARLRGDLVSSRRHLAQRIADFPPASDGTLSWIWAARLDLAYTLVLMRDPGAAAALAEAATHRPPHLPAGQPLDEVAAYLRERLAAGSDNAAPVRAALDRLARAQARPGPWPAGSGLASLGGAFL